MFQLEIYSKGCASNYVSLIALQEDMTLVCCC